MSAQPESEAGRGIRVTRRGFIEGGLAVITVAAGGLITVPPAQRWLADSEQRRLDKENRHFVATSYSQQNGGVDSAFPLPAPSPEQLRVIDWLIPERNSPSRLGGSIVRLESGGYSGLYIPDLQIAGISNFRADSEDVFAVGKNTPFGNKVTKYSDIDYLQLLSAGIRTVSFRDQDFTIAADGIVPLLLRGTALEPTENIRNSIMDPVVAMKSLGVKVEAIDLERIGQSEIKFIFGKDVPLEGGMSRELQVSSTAISERYEPSGTHKPVDYAVPPELLRPTSLQEVIEFTGGRQLVRAALGGLVGGSFQAAASVLREDAEAIMGRVEFDKDRPVVPENVKNWFTDPNKFAVTRDMGVVRSQAKTYALLGLNTPLRIVL